MAIARVMNRLKFLRSAALIVGVLACWADGTRAAEDDQPVDFQRHIAPLIRDRCIRCHQPANRKGDISLATLQDVLKAGYILPGLPDESYVVELVTSTGEGKPRMPKEGQPLSKEEVELLRRWIRQGAPWPDGVVIKDPRRADTDWWSLQPLADATPPSVDQLLAGTSVRLDVQARPWLADWLHHPVDRFVLHQLLQRGLHPSPPADRRTLIRRVTFDLIGLPPTPEEIEQFLADPAPDAYERLVDRLLASPQYGEQWGRHWLDVVRFGESNGFERNVLIHDLWPFRDYVIRSFNTDKPFDRLVLEHLAGDVIAPGDPETEIGTAFLVCGPYDNVGNQDPVQAAIIRANTLDEIIRAVGETFLGFTIGCARCHDHKFDPITQRDYYAWYATFAGVSHGSRVWATPQQRAVFEANHAELVRRRDEIRKELDSLKEEIHRRAAQNAERHATRWKRPPVSRTGTEEVFEPIEARWVRLVVEGLDTNPELRTGYRIDEFQVWTDEQPPRNVALQSQGTVAEGRSREAEDFRGAYSAMLVNDGKYGERWIAQSPQLVLKFARPERIRRVVFSSDGTGEAGSLPEATFVSDYYLEVSLDGEHWTRVADSFDRQPLGDAHRRKRLFDAEVTEPERHRLAQLSNALQQAQAALAALPQLPTAWMGVFSQPAGQVRVFLRGDPQQPGEPTPPASLAMLEAVVPPYRLAEETPEATRRLRLAEWLVAPENPLTLRVLANRIWHYHFGVGLVDTPSDFGYMGGRPTHPELLDWLARQIPRYQWQLKAIHRLIVTSQTYRQSSLASESVATEAGNPRQIDADARFYWHFPARRLVAEEIRDAMLFAAQALQTRMGGPGFRLYRYLEDNVATYVPLDHHGPETYRRAVYHQNARAARVDLLAEFDCPDSALAAPRRASTTTPLQALTLLNHAFTVEMAELLAERVQREGEAHDLGGQIRKIFYLVYGRPPDDEELRAASELTSRYGLRALCRALWNSNEFLYLR